MSTGAAAPTPSAGPPVGISGQASVPDSEDELCDTWLQDRTTNPATG